MASRSLASVMLCAIVSAASAAGAVVDVHFAGIVWYASDTVTALYPSIDSGAPFAGSLSYDPDIDADLYPEEPMIGTYHPARPWSVKVGDLLFQDPAGPNIYVFNDDPWDAGGGYSGLRDVFSVINRDPVQTGTLSWSILAFQMEDYFAHDAFDSDSLPLPGDGLSAADFPDGNSFIATAVASTYVIQGNVTSLAVVPEPTASVLVLFGLPVVLRLTPPARRDPGPHP